MLLLVLGGLALACLVGLALAVRVVKEYERGVQFRLGRVVRGARGPGPILIIPLIDRVQRVSMRIVTLPVRALAVSTRDGVRVDVSAVVCYRVEDPVRAVMAIENVAATVDEIVRATLRAAVARHTLDETRSASGVVEREIRASLAARNAAWGVSMTVAFNDIVAPPMNTVGEFERLLSSESRAAHLTPRSGLTVPREPVAYAQTAVTGPPPAAAAATMHA